MTSTQRLPKTTVTLRIFAPELDPEEVTRNLDLEPNHKHKLGDPIPKRSGSVNVYKHGMWTVDSKLPETEVLVSHLDSLLSDIEPKQEYIKTLASYATVDLYCVLYDQSGFELPPDILHRIADLGITFGVVLYANNPSD